MWGGKMVCQGGGDAWHTEVRNAFMYLIMSTASSSSTCGARRLMASTVAHFDQISAAPTCKAIVSKRDPKYWMGWGWVGWGEADGVGVRVGWGAMWWSWVGVG